MLRRDFLPPRHASRRTFAAPGCRGGSCYQPQTRAESLVMAAFAAGVASARGAEGCRRRADRALDADRWRVEPGRWQAWPSQEIRRRDAPGRATWDIDQYTSRSTRWWRAPLTNGPIKAAGEDLEQLGIAELAVAVGCERAVGKPVDRVAEVAAAAAYPSRNTAGPRTTDPTAYARAQRSGVMVGTSPTLPHSPLRDVPPELFRRSMATGTATSPADRHTTETLRSSYAGAVAARVRPPAWSARRRAPHPWRQPRAP